MLLSSLQIFGFKSYPVRTEIEFSHGINGVVGPPDCGRSNVIDALRWCMGEPDLAALRASDPEDLVYAGSFQRPKMIRATVSAIFSDCPPGWGLVNDELRITRQLNVRTGTDLLTGQNGALASETVTQLLASVALDPARLVFDQNTVQSAPDELPIMVLKLRALTDESNAQELLERHGRQRQLIVFTDEKPVMALCDWMLGVTMEEYGVSTAFKMQLRPRTDNGPS